MRVTEAEAEILEALWRCGPIAPARLFAELQARRPWRTPTIKTLLARLMRKGAVRAERSEGRLVYRPLIDRANYVETEVDDLVQRVFAGDREALARFLDDRRPS